MIVSEKIFILLQKKGMSQKEFSQRTGISQSTISDWKRKKTNPSVNKILTICEVLQISPYELLSENDLETRGSSADYMMPLNKEESILLENYRRLDHQRRERIMGYMSALEEE
ncbi:transcriptional repressor DicA [Eubacteriaceae bacterium CHKCI004]|nr:transcriptional repressor DicA [Eubacteriaceae bacterium CHKCI004]